MLPVYKAISFQAVIDKGGRTRPWVIFVKTEDGIKPYVVKLFEPTEVELGNAVANEVYGNVLAYEFGLPVPRSALIDFDYDFIDTIRQSELLKVLDFCDERLKFGTEYLHGYVPFNNRAFNSTEARRIIDIDSVFAFDNLIRNIDRRDNPPNLLMRSDSAFLIDHELAFKITKDTINEIIDKRWDNRFYDQHLFYRYLKHSNVNTKEHYFNEFQEYLRLLNVNILDGHFKQLIDLGFPSIRNDILKDYLVQAKLNSFNFVKLMRAIIQ